MKLLAALALNSVFLMSASAALASDSTLSVSQSTAGAAVPAVSCSLKSRAQNVNAQVTIERGNVQSLKAQLIYSSSNGLEKSSYTVVKTESSDLKTEFYQGPGFSMVVDAVSGKANLKAALNQQNVNLMKMKCQFSEIGRL